MDAYYDKLMKKEEAIEKAAENCQKYKDFISYGVPSLEERLPSPTTSVLSFSGSSVKSSKNLIIAKIAEEQEDYKFIHKMQCIFSALEPPYSDLFFKVFRDLVPIKHLKNGSAEGVENENVYKQLKIGYLKIALLDADIDYSYRELMQLEEKKRKHNKKKQIIKLRIKAEINDLKSLIISNKLDIQSDLSFYFNDIDTIDPLIKTKAEKMIAIIDDIPDKEKKIIISYLLDKNGTLKKNTSFYVTFEIALLAIALIDEDLDYSIKDFKTDLSKNKRSYSKYLANIKQRQLKLKI